VLFERFGCFIVALGESNGTAKAPRTQRNFIGKNKFLCVLCAFAVQLFCRDAPALDDFPVFP
jgi:hypothetical protein